jgi:hypothetical protein
MHLASWLIAAVISLDKSSTCAAALAHEIVKNCAPVCLVLVDMLVRAKLFFYGY